MAARIPLWGRAVPALLALLVAIPTFALSFTIPTSVVYSETVCCPRRVVERVVDKDTSATVFFWALIAVSLLAVVAAGLFVIGRVRVASVVAGVAAPVAFLTPMFLIAPVLLLAAIVLAHAASRRGSAATRTGYAGSE